MKRLVAFSSLFLSSVFVCLAASSTALGQKGCEFNIVGTWKAASPAGAAPVVYRFGPDATVTVLSASVSSKRSELREIARGVYSLDNPKAPKTVLLKSSKGGGGLVRGTTSIDIVGYDDTSFTSVKLGSLPTHWLRVDPYRYFIVLAGSTGAFYDTSGPTFPILIRMDDAKIQVDAAVGIYSVKGARTFGPVPVESYTELMKEPRTASNVMLRLEITEAQYERGLKILRTWERRARENTLLYPEVTLDNVLLVKQVTETLNQCGEKIKLYKLDWGIEDKISENNRVPLIPFYYFKELRRLNEKLHVTDEKFQQRGHPMQHRAGL